MTNLENFVQAETEKHEEERKAEAKAKGYRPLLQLVKGINNVTIDLMEAPRKITYKNKFDPKKGDVTKNLFHVLGQKEDMDLMVSFPLYRQILKKLQTVPHDDPEVTLQIMRSGEGTDTRYEVL